MKARKALCTLLVTSMTLLPIHAVRADMIALERVPAIQGTPQDAHRAALTELQAHGISADMARERVAAMTDEEAASLAARLESLPAGGNVAFAFLAVMLFFAFVIYQTRETK